MTRIEEVLVKNASIFDKETFTNKDEMFKYMALKLKESKVISDAEKFIKSLYERESEGSTYMGRFIGLPHGKCKEVNKPGVAFCKCKSAFNYESHGEVGEVKYIFMLAISEQQTGEQYMKILSTIARLLAHDSFIDKLENCNSFEDLVNEIKQYER